MTVPALKPPNHYDGRHDLRFDQADMNRLVSVDGSADLGQEQPLGAGTDTPARRGWSYRLAYQAQAHAGRGRASVNTQAFERVKIDDAYLASELAGKPCKRRRGSPNKVAFAMAVSPTNERKPYQVLIRCMSFRPSPFGIGPMNPCWPKHAPYRRSWRHNVRCAPERQSSGDHDPFQAHLARASRVPVDQHLAGRYIRVLSGTTRLSPPNMRRAIFQYGFNRRHNLHPVSSRLLRAVATTKPWTEPRLKAVDSGPNQAALRWAS